MEHTNFKKRGILDLITELFIGKEKYKENRMKREVIQRNREIRRREIANARNFINNLSNKNLSVKDGFSFDMSKSYDMTSVRRAKKVLSNEKYIYLKNFIESDEFSRLSHSVAELNYLKSECIKINDNYIHERKELKNIIETLGTFLSNRKDYIKNEFDSCKAGLNGEEVVNQELDIHSNLINLKNIRISDSQGNISQCDNIIISKNGIFIIEVKNYGENGKYSILVDNTGRWTAKSGRVIRAIDSPVQQNTRHLAVLNRKLKEELGFENILSEGIISISNDVLNLINESDSLIVRPSMIYDVISNRRNFNLSEEDQLKIKNFILDNNIGEKRYPIYPVKGEFNKEFLDIMDALLLKITDAIKYLQ